MSARAQERARQEQADAEAAASAAAAEFDQVAKRNEEDMEDFSSRKVGEVLHLLLAWAHSLQVHAEAEADAWLRAARDMGCDARAVDAIAAL